MFDDLKWGAKWGLFCGILLGCYAGLILLLKEELPRGVSPLVLVMSYPAAGLAGGMLVGILRPLIRSRRSSAVIGALVGIPVSALLMQPLIGTVVDTWDGAAVFSVVFTGIILGGFAGHNWWSP